MQKMLGFDPLIYLGLDKSLKNSDTSYKLLSLISEYITIRTLSDLGDINFSSVKTANQLFALAGKKLPNFDQKVKMYLDDFKKEVFK